MWRITVFLVILSTVSGLPKYDPVIAKGNGSRYQHLYLDNGLSLVDTWLKVSNLEAAARYNPDQDNIYYLFTRAQPTFGYPLLLGNTALLQQTDFDPARRTVVLVHGWLGNVFGTSNLVLIPNFLSAEDVNVIVVDWSAGAITDYVTAILNVITSGQGAARFITWLNSVTGASLDDYHLVGHSLGGHQVGVIGRNLDGRAAYITSLDPAGPLWYNHEHMFTPTDGVYTEVIHTNVGENGYMDPIGDVDFYPNGGNYNPGCNDQFCDHDRCFYFLAESLISGGFEGVQCPTYAAAVFGACNLSGRLNMGGLRPKTGSTGVYHLTTNAASPFSLR